MTRLRTPVALVLPLAGVLAATGCGGGGDASPAAGGATPIEVTSTDTACTLSTTSTPGGTVTFRIANRGARTTEFYLYGADGKRIVAEVENVGAGAARNLVVKVSPGAYVTACKPGMAGDGIRAAFTVTEAATTAPTVDAATAALLRDATDTYARFVRDEAAQLLSATERFAALVTAGDDAAARSLYPVARTHWERIEPVAESFGDLDPRLDLREADLEDGAAWTGWHRFEKALWPPASGAGTLEVTERTALAAQLVADTRDLAGRVQTLTYDPTQLGNGAKELLDEVATGKVTGEEEAWSHTDLWDFQANVDGARTAFVALRPVVAARDAALATTLDARFAAVQAGLDRHRAGDGFVTYDTLTAGEVQALADAVDALGEPLSQLTSVVAA